MTIAPNPMAPPPQQEVDKQPLAPTQPQVPENALGLPKPTAPPPAPANASNVGKLPTEQVAPQLTPSQSVVSAVSQAIALGLAPTPTTNAGWAALAEKYSTASGKNDIINIKNFYANGGAPSVNTSPAAGGGTPVQGPQGVAQFLAATRQHESGGDYTAYNAGGGASGAYQYIQSTWSSEARAAGYGQYANAPAGNAPPAVQDAVAAYNASQLYSQYGSWKDVAEAWYYPAWAGNPSMQNSVPYPSAGNTETIGAYGDQIVSMMGGPAANAPAPQAQINAAAVGGGTNAVIRTAQTQLGVQYQWGGESPGQDFDCSGLVQWVYGQNGVQLPRVAQDQYNATAKVALNQVQPGDLLFFGGGTNSITHVGIYIGNGQMIDAPHTGAQVRVESFGGWGDLVGATRPGDPSGASTLPTQGTGATQTTSANAGMTLGAIQDQVTKALQNLVSIYPAAVIGRT